MNVIEEIRVVTKDMQEPGEPIAWKHGICLVRLPGWHIQIKRLLKEDETLFTMTRISTWTGNQYPLIMGGRLIKFRALGMLSKLSNFVEVARNQREVNEHRFNKGYDIPDDPKPGCKLYQKIGGK